MAAIICPTVRTRLGRTAITGQESVFFPELAPAIKVDLSVAVCRNSRGLSAASNAIGTPANLKVSGCKEKRGGHEERGNYRVTAPSRRL
jgi:hypothetical protein